VARYGRPDRWRDPGVVSVLLAEAQALPYAPDDAGPVDLVTTDLDTVTREGGDCEERSMWLAAHLVWHGFAAWLAWVTQRGAPLDHVSTLVELGGRRRWVDATVPGARIGEAPEDAAGRVMSSGAPVGVYGGRINVTD